MWFFSLYAILLITLSNQHSNVVAKQAGGNANPMFLPQNVKNVYCPKTALIAFMNHSKTYSNGRIDLKFGVYIPVMILYQFPVSYTHLTLPTIYSV